MSDGSLYYNGSGFRPGIPGRDLSPAEVKEFGGSEFLISTGMFERAPIGPRQISGRQINKNLAVEPESITEEGVEK
jgi:hypothetical protein